MNTGMQRDFRHLGWLTKSSSKFRFTDVSLIWQALHAYQQQYPWSLTRKMKHISMTWMIPNKRSKHSKHGQLTLYRSKVFLLLRSTSWATRRAISISVSFGFLTTSRWVLTIVSLGRMTFLSHHTRCPYCKSLWYITADFLHICKTLDSEYAWESHQISHHIWRPV